MSAGTDTERTPRVAQVCLSGAWGGLEMTTLEAAVDLQNRGWLSAVVTLPGAPLSTRAKEAGLEVIELSRTGYIAPRSVLQLRRAVDRLGLNVLVIHQLRNLWIVVPALWGRPHVRLIGYAKMFLRNVKKTGWLHRYLYGRLEMLLALCPSQMKALRLCLPVPLEKYQILPVGVDTSCFSSGRRSLSLRQAVFGASDQDIVVGLVGRVDPQKGHREFLLAAADVLKVFPHTKFVLIGGETVGEEGFVEEIRHLVEKNGIADQVLFLGPRSDVAELMASMDIFVMASYEEAFGAVTIEAMASGLPVVGTDSGGTPDIVQNGVTGLLVAPRSAEALAGGLMALLRDPGRARAMGQEGRTLVEKSYGKNQVAERFARLIQKTPLASEKLREDA